MVEMKDMVRLVLAKEKCDRRVQIVCNVQLEVKEKEKEKLSLMMTTVVVAAFLAEGLLYSTELSTYNISPSFLSSEAVFL